MKKTKFILMSIMLFAILTIPNIVNAKKNVYVDFLCSYPNSESYVAQVKSIKGRNDIAGDYVREFVKNDSEKTITIYLDGNVESVLYLDENNMVSGYANAGYDYQTHYVSYYDDEIVVYEGFQGGGEFHIKRDGSCVYNNEVYKEKTNRDYEYDNLGRVIYSKGDSSVLNIETWIEYRDVAEVYSFDMENISTPNTPKKGKITKNGVQWTGDIFQFTALTSQNVTEISICADKPDGTWHEIDYAYLKENYGLKPTDRNGGVRAWTCWFDIHELGERTFRLKVNGMDTNVYTNATLYENISVNVDSKEIEFDVPPMTINGRTMLPVRAVAEALGGVVWWDEETNEAWISGKTRYGVERKCCIQIGNDYMKWEDVGAWLDGGDYGTVKLDSPAVVIDGRTLVPLRAIAEVFEYLVAWDEENQLVNIYAFQAIQ